MKNSPWSNVWFNFSIWIENSVLSSKLATSFSAFSNFHSFWYEWLNHYKNHVIFQDIEHQLQKNILHNFFHYSFVWNLHLIEKYLYPLKVIYWKPLQHCPTIWIIYIPILKIWPFLIFVIIFRVFVISFWILINRVRYGSSFTFCYH